MTQVYEVNFDGLVGPTHHYAGLSYGNLASIDHAHMISNPQQAALQGLSKMRLMVRLGLKQGILLPHPRPPWKILHQLGFTGNEQDVLEKLAQSYPEMFSAFFSSSFMWAANAATITPSSDSADHKVHITVANLAGNFHRAIEAEFNQAQFQTIFSGSPFVVHPPLPFGVQFSDEGAANHMRLSANHAKPGLQIFVYGRSGVSSKNPSKYPARQSVEASQAIARIHSLATPALFLQQDSRAIDAGIFHNDVIAVSNENIILYHEHAYQDAEALKQIQKLVDFNLHVIGVSAQELTLQETVSSYLFNSQIVTLPDQSMLMLLPAEVQESVRAQAVVDRIVEAKNPIGKIEFIDCRQSMLNGGGPACLRLRVVLNEQELNAVNPSYLLDEHKIGLLESWVKKHYRDRLAVKDFLDPKFRDSCTRALEELPALILSNLQTR